MVIASLIAHLAALAAAWLGPRWMPQAIPRAPILVVDLVSLPPGGLGPLQRPRGTARRPPAKKTALAPAPKPRKPKAVKLPEPVSKPAPQKIDKPEPKPPPPEPSGPATGAVLGPEASEEPAVEPGIGGEGPLGLGEAAEGGIGALDAEAFEFAWYRRALTQRLRAAWTKPTARGLEKILRTVVYFRLLRSGQTVDIQLESSSGMEALDRSALRAVYDANPLPPLPHSYGGRSLGVHFFFELKPE